MRALLAGFLLFTHTALAQTSMTSPVATVPAFGSPQTTVAGLPVCNAASLNLVATVSNALTPVLGSTVVGLGAVVTLVHCNGTNWVVG